MIWQYYFIDSDKLLATLDVFNSANPPQDKSRMHIFIMYPVLAFLPAVLFASAFIHLRVSGGKGMNACRFIVIATSVTWILYFCYEIGMQSIFSPNSDPIRIDLLLIYPALLLLTILGVMTYLIDFLHPSEHNFHRTDLK